MSETRQILRGAMRLCLSHPVGCACKGCCDIYERLAPTETVEHGEDAIVRELLCEMCGRDYPVWAADSELWNEVMRSPGPEYEYAFVCPTCFTVRAAFMGIETAFHVARLGQDARNG